MALTAPVSLSWDFLIFALDTFKADPSEQNRMVLDSQRATLNTDLANE